MLNSILKNSMEPKEGNNEITLENDPIYNDSITAEELVQKLDEFAQENKYVYSDYFNNFHLHFIDPAYLKGDNPKLQNDLQNEIRTAEEKHWKNTEKTFMQSINSKRGLETYGKEELPVFAEVYINMIRKGYPRYQMNGDCIIR